MEFKNQIQISFYYKDGKPTHLVTVVGQYFFYNKYDIIHRQVVLRDYPININVFKDKKRCHLFHQEFSQTRHLKDVSFFFSTNDSFVRELIDLATTHNPRLRIQQLANCQLILEFGKKRLSIDKFFKIWRMNSEIKNGKKPKIFWRKDVFHIFSESILKELCTTT